MAGVIRVRQTATTHRRAAGAMTALGLTAILVAGMLTTVSQDADSTGPIQIASTPDYHPEVFSVPHTRGPEPGRFGGLDDLVTLMGTSGTKWYRSAMDDLRSGPDGLIDPDDVVLIKINAQWAERGGTNTDLLRGLIRAIVEHPDGFVGEVVVADNGQGYGNLERGANNAEDIAQSVLDVVNDFVAEGWKVSTQLWDLIRGRAVGEYSAGDARDGYVVSSTADADTLVKVSYPKFQSAYGTTISYKRGIWSAQDGAYDSSKLVVINVPILKTHSIYAITAGVKNHMGVVTQGLNTDSHNGVGRGGLGSVLAQVRTPDLTILDCIWILARPGAGPSASYTAATRRDQLLAARDPLALDVWAAKNVLVPEIVRNGYTLEAYGPLQDPDNPDSVFRRYLDRTMAELLQAGIPATNDPAAVELHVWTGDQDADGDIDAADVGGLASCLTGPNGATEPACRAFDSDNDADADLLDLSRFQRAFTDSQP